MESPGQKRGKQTRISFGLVFSIENQQKRERERERASGGGRGEGTE